MNDAGELALTARNASIEDLVALLPGQQARKVVAPASAIRAGVRSGDRRQARHPGRLPEADAGVPAGPVRT